MFKEGDKIKVVKNFPNERFADEIGIVKRVNKLGYYTVTVDNLDITLFKDEMNLVE